jgi:two-component system NtrC family sensor kinase
VATVLSASLTTFRLRERLADGDRRYRTLLDSSPDALFVERLDGTILEANDAAQAIFRADGPWLIGRRPLDLAIYDDPRPRDLTRALAVGASFRVQSIGIRRDGERFPQEVDVRRVDLDGEPRLLVRIRDLTDQERLQAELIQAQKMESTGQLVSGVAHELNNPLASILGFSQLIRRDAALPEDLRHNADLLVEEASRTRRIVQNLLDFARQRPPERYPTSIGTLVDSVVALQSYSVDAGEIGLEVVIDPDLPLIELDRGQLQQVLINLTQNAVYAVREGGGSRVRIGAVLEPSASGDRVRVTVMDDGPGVPPENVERLFEAFFTTKPPTKGTGLGLPVSYGIIRSHGGELRYQPSAFGRGAAFTFDLPVRAAPIDRPTVVATPTPAGEVARSVASQAPAGAAATPTVDSAEAEHPPRPRILVLDDEPAIRIFLTKALGALGFEAVPTASGKEAVEAARNGEYVAFLVDHQMAGLSGLDVYEVIVSERPDYGPRFVVMSGDVLNPALERFSAATGIEVLGKPFDLDTLDRTVRALVDGQARG